MRKCGMIFYEFSLSMKMFYYFPRISTFRIIILYIIIIFHYIQIIILCRFGNWYLNILYVYEMRISVYLLGHMEIITVTIHILYTHISVSLFSYNRINHTHTHILLEANFRWILMHNQVSCAALFIYLFCAN